jgi:hypothetical protein
VREEEIRKKISVLGYRIVLWVFFLYMRCQLVIEGQKTSPLRTNRREVIPIDAVDQKKKKEKNFDQCWVTNAVGLW